METNDVATWNMPRQGRGMSKKGCDGRFAARASDMKLANGKIDLIGLGGRYCRVS